MRRLLALFGLIIVLGSSVLALGAVATATDDDPCGSLFDHKVEPLDGYTFTVPTPPAGWTVEYVVLKVGGPGGGTHITFDDVEPGDVLSVAYQQYEISHAHVCKSQGGTTSTSTTTSTSVSTSTSTTSTSTVASSTLPEPTTTLGVTTTVVNDDTSTSSPTTSTTASSTSLPSTSTSVQLIEPPLPSSGQPDTTVPGAITTSTGPSRSLPTTGNEGTISALMFAAILMAVGFACIRAVRRP